MELFREDYLRRLGPNRGEEIYNRLLASELEDKIHPENLIITKKVVRNALESYPNILGPLDATDILNNLHEDDQCDFFKKYPSCDHLQLKNWTFMSDKVLRSISISLGHSITTLDVSGSHIDNGQFEILIARMPILKSLNISNCPNADGKCMATLSKYCNNNMLELNASNCILFKYEPLQWITGMYI
jgi:hypothetical protein